MIDKKYLPSKKFLMALYTAVAIILVAVVLNYFQSNTTKYTNNSLASATDTANSFATLDSDHDGLPDWKEALYGTDPHKADTDGDGTSDLQEILQNRDPLKPNTAPPGQEPNDKIDPAIIEKNQTALVEYEKLNEIDKFSRNLVSNVIASQPTSGPMDQSAMDSILLKSLGEIPQKNYVAVTKSSDLNLLKTDNTNLVKNMTDYVNNFYLEIAKLPLLLGKDLNVISSYISNGNASDKLELLKIADRYQIIVNNLIKMPVPVAIGYYDINYHLNVINDLEIILAVDRDIANSDKDSLGIFPNMSIYNKASSDLISTLDTIGSILKIQ